MTADADKPPLEIQHFWLAPAERTALASIEDALAERGETGVVATGTSSSSSNRALALRRIVAGVAPFALQWHAGRELHAMAETGVILSLAPVAKAMAWKGVLHPEVLTWVSVQGAAYALPVGVHAENWAWFNARMLREMGSAVPQDWSGLIDALNRSAATGGPGIAMGRDPWQRMLLFSAILVSEGGEAAYRALNEGADPHAADHPAVRRALEIFASIRHHDRRDSLVRTWQDGAEAVARGSALVQVMGDWVRPELARLGAEPGRDFECVLAVGREKRHLSVVDAMVFPRQADARLSQRHRDFAEAVLDPATQREFARRKGAIPVRSDLAQGFEDDCIAASYSLFATPGASLPARAMFAAERISRRLDGVISNFWDDTASTPEDGHFRIRNAMQAELDAMR